MRIRTLILDDDENSRLAACTALAEYPEIEIQGEFAAGEELFAFLQERTAELLFLDIELKEETGFAAAKRLREEYPSLLIVFLTGHSSYAIDGYDFQPVHFLTKPINREKLAQTIAEVRRRLGQEQKGQQSAGLMFRLLKGYTILDVKDICYIERLGRKNYLHTAKETLRIANYTMHELEEMLAEHDFFLCHQSFLVSLHRVQAVRDARKQLYEAVVRDCEEAVPVSRNRYEEMLQHLKRLGIRTI